MSQTQIADAATRRIKTDPPTTPGTNPWRTEIKPASPGRRREDGIGANQENSTLGVPVRYQILSQVGTGGMGIVYKVRDLDTGEIVALKVLKPGIASDRGMQEGLRKEVCLARKVTHKNVCRIHEFNRSRGTACLSMEFVEGETLLSLINRTGRLSVEGSIGIALQICAGLREAHAQGIIHRDLKPANVMLDATGVVKIMDFGIARLTETNSQMTGTIAGTPAYMAPEQLELKPMGPCTDIYAVGLLLYEMATGLPAFEGDSAIAVALQQIRECPKPPSEIVSGLPAQIEDVISKCLRKDPAKRFQSVDELCAALEKGRAAKGNVPGWVSLEVRLPHLPVHCVVDYGKEKARQAAPHLAAFGLQARQAGLRAGRLVNLGVSKSVAKGGVLVRDLALRTNLRSVKMTRTRSVAAVTAFALLGTVVFGWEVSGKHHRKGEPLQSPAAIQTAPQTIARNARPSVVADADSAIMTNEVDLNRSSDAVSAAEMSAPVKQEVPGAKTVSGAPIAPVNSGSTILAKASQPKLSAPAKTLPKDNLAESSPAKAAMNPRLPVVELEPSEAAVPATLAQPATSGHSEGAEKPVAGAADPTEHFLEVGSFKDSIWADQAVEKLSHLGYHAVAIHKAHLWIQSYHVEVGPYKTTTEMEAAQKMLTSQNFKSHEVK